MNNKLNCSVDNQPLPVGISSCLLGNRVRYDGHHQYHEILNQHLSHCFHWVPYCPEMAIGLGTPRPPIQLVKTAEGIQVQATEEPRIEFTHRLNMEAKTFQPEIYGFVFKARSPSCGLGSTKVFDEDDQLLGRFGFGAFAKSLRVRWPEMPMLEDTELDSEAACEVFARQVKAYYVRTCCADNSRSGNFRT